MIRPTGSWLAWQQLLRAGNAPTAASNVAAGFLLSRSDWQPIGLLLTLVAASILLYESGMVLNDVFDSDVDERERPERPIPSGRIRRQDAMAVGWSLLAGGVLCSGLASWMAGGVGPAIVASCLAATVVMYNGGLKATWAGPLAMGWCRTLNVLLGGSASPALGADWELWWYAAAIGVYTAGLTIYAQAEQAEQSAAVRTRGEKVTGLGLMMVLPLLMLPRALRTSSPIGGDWTAWVCAWLALTGAYAASLYRARITGTTAGYRQHVSAVIVGFLLLDALISWAAAGRMAGLAVLALILPILLGARRAPMT